MLGDLNKKEIDDLLKRQFIGRLGCHLEGETYIVPINYVYQNNAIYAHSGEGKKLEMLRGNPRVCFQVDEIESMFKWKSVILWGTFEELKGQERQQVMQGLILRIMPNTNDAGRDPSHGIPPELHDNLIVYKINIQQGTGRFEIHE
ncbi:pyridoxamine 5'-phosphate oxidase family protein [Sphingobacterium sp. N143]|uniref:pyridoxamine 5'-phosphate oxidase family protein n=1 Tax=Sphingobacterium sp. N143 TaxID=2746727 RepID=UPI00257816F0|nr:pyridoxamine 5'-phosphate oxidase family protein [Sphingobacterium sp. N143]MDM1296310.1 pyridoxamine 5'-phosphate oxidase family protein [Sphingobacterium sp. N143]